MEKLLAKKNIVLVSLFLFSALMWTANYYAFLPHRLAYLLYFFFFSISFSSLFISFLSDEITRVWFRFLSWWTPLSLALIFLDNPYNSFVFPGSMGLMRIISFTTLFFALFLVAIKTWELRRAKQGKPFAPLTMTLMFSVAFVASFFLSEIPLKIMGY